MAWVYVVSASSAIVARGGDLFQRTAVTKDTPLQCWLFSRHDIEATDFRAYGDKRDNKQRYSQHDAKVHTLHSYVSLRHWG